MNPRRAAHADAQGIAEVHVASWQAAYRGLFPAAVLDHLSVADRRAQWEARLAEGAWSIWVTGNDDHVSGFISSCQSRDADLPPPQFAEVAALYIRADAWSTGCGYALCQAALAEMRQGPATTAIVWVLTGNTRARGFYERMGFTPEGASKDVTFFNVTLPELRYRLPLH